MKKGVNAQDMVAEEIRKNPAVVVLLIEGRKTLIVWFGGIQVECLSTSFRIAGEDRGSNFDHLLGFWHGVSSDSLPDMETGMHGSVILNAFFLHSGNEHIIFKIIVPRDCRCNVRSGGSES